MMNFLAQLWNKSFNLNLGKYSLPVAYWEAIAIVVLLFVLVIMMAQFRRHYIDWSFKGAAFGIFFGFLLALTLEGFLIIGGKTAIIQVLGWKNPPQPIQMALDAGRAQLVKVLGTETQLSSYDNAIQSVQSLTPADSKKFKALICQP